MIFTSLIVGFAVYKIITSIMPKAESNVIHFNTHITENHLHLKKDIDISDYSDIKKLHNH